MDRGSDGAGGRLPPEHGTRTAPGGVAPALLHVRGLGVERAPVQADLLQVRACGFVGVHCRIFLAVLVRHPAAAAIVDRKSTRLNSSHVAISYAVFCLKKKISIISLSYATPY